MLIYCFPYYNFYFVKDFMLVSLNCPMPHSPDLSNDVVVWPVYSPLDKFLRLIFKQISLKVFCVCH